MTTIPNNPIFNDEDAARAHLERLRWPQGVLCVHCGAFGDAISKVEKTDKRRKPADPSQEAQARPRRPLLLQRVQGTFTVTVGHGHGGQPHPDPKWLYAFREFLASKNGVSAHQLHRTSACRTRRLGSWATASVKRCARAALLRR